MTGRSTEIQKLRKNSLFKDINGLLFSNLLVGLLDISAEIIINDKLRIIEMITIHIYLYISKIFTVYQIFFCFVLYFCMILGPRNQEFLEFCAYK